ncbi:Uncharacterized protein HZ326_30992 [Fusarium oxysporum f. sp. albedinis]|nr:Uncharacterized protein HZ326_30992 [Fusarium oxysporum f. sp. albedinis]
MSREVTIGRWSESWSRLRSTSLLMTRSAKPRVAKQRSIVACLLPSSYVMVPGAKVLCQMELIELMHVTSTSIKLTGLTRGSRMWGMLASPTMPTGRGVVVSFSLERSLCIAEGQGIFPPNNVRGFPAVLLALAVGSACPSLRYFLQWGAISLKTPRGTDDRG